MSSTYDIGKKLLYDHYEEGIEGVINHLNGISPHMADTLLKLTDKFSSIRCLPISKEK